MSQDSIENHTNIWFFILIYFSVNLIESAPGRGLNTTCGSKSRNLPVTYLTASMSSETASQSVHVPCEIGNATFDSQRGVSKL